MSTAKITLGTALGATIVAAGIGFAGGLGIAFMSGLLGIPIAWTNELAYGTCLGIMLPVLAVFLYLVHRAPEAAAMPPPPPPPPGV